MSEHVGMVLAAGLAILFIGPIHRLLWWAFAKWDAWDTCDCPLCSRRKS